ncbi:MAG TPA: DUF6040 family protein, partial [Chitinispirillaceae bacterium]|nr:DUF6040 family protein [Chitinispirillaceae bacterium]
DFRAFWIGFWKIIYSVAVLIGDGFSQIANLCDMIPQHYVAVVAHWIVLIGLVFGLGVLIAYGFMKLIEFSAEPVINGITPWNCSVSVIALVAVVFFGDYIKNIIKFNLFGTWIILTIILIGLGMYLPYGKSNRGYY